MITRFRPLCTLRTTHGFYDGPSRDFQYAIPADTARTLRDGKLLAKEVAGILHILYEADELGLPLRPINGAKLRFGQVLTDPYFSNFTDIAQDFAATTRLYSNADVPGSLVATESVRLAGNVLSHVISDATRPVTVMLYDAAGTLLFLEQISAGRDVVSFDTHGVARGSLRVIETYPTTGREFPCYTDPELLIYGVTGVVEITIGSGMYSLPPDFIITFVPRADFLKYYVCATNYSTLDLDAVTIVDDGYVEEERDPIAFTRIAADDLGPGDISSDILSNIGDRFVLFRSNDPVPRRERGWKKIQLRNTIDTLIANLPQPKREQSSADMIIHISKP